MKPFISSMQAALALGLLVAGCAASQVPATSISASQTAIRTAEAAGAGIDPKAALHLSMARTEYNQARQLIVQEDTHKAELVLARASSDAQLAFALARAASAKAEAEHTMDEIRALQASPQLSPR